MDAGWSAGPAGAGPLVLGSAGLPEMEKRKMVLYFSATGNTRYVANKLAGLLGDESLDLLDRIRRKDYGEIHSDRPFVLCSPVYVCEMPRFLADYLRKVKLTGSREVYCIFTSGGYAGISGILARRLFRRKGMVYKGHGELKMPRNYISNNSYPELGREEIEKRILSSHARIPALADRIRRGARLKSRHVWFFEVLVTLPVNPFWYYKMQPVGDFYATDRCISCGKCVRLCPLNVISLAEGKPVWSGKSCAHCMSCIQNCPVEAIEYGNVTQLKKRYRFDKYKYLLKD